MAIDGGAYKLESGLKKHNQKRIEAGWEQIKEKLAQLRKTSLDILHYTKDREPEYTTVSLHHISFLLHDAVRSKAVRHGIRLQTDLPPLDIHFQADAHALESALFNIVDNAVESCVYAGTKREHTVTIEARYVPTSDDTLHEESTVTSTSFSNSPQTQTVLPTSGNIVFSFHDTGTGMDEETLENMFTLFFSSKGAQGTGIGLYVAYEIIAAHDGDVKVSSQIGQGTTFTVTLPVFTDQ